LPPLTVSNCQRNILENDFRGKKHLKKDFDDMRPDAGMADGRFQGLGLGRQQNSRKCLAGRCQVR